MIVSFYKLREFQFHILTTIWYGQFCFLLFFSSSVPLTVDIGHLFMCLLAFLYVLW